MENQSNTPSTGESRKYDEINVTTKEKLEAGRYIYRSEKGKWKLIR
jgi:hypothetical protein